MFGVKKTSLSLRGAASILALFTLIAFYLGPFYWPSSNSSWAASIRSLALVSVILYFVSGARFCKPGLLGLVWLVLCSYLLLNALFIGKDTQSARRVIYIFCFASMLAMFWREPSRPQIFITAIAVVGASFAAFSLGNLYWIGELEFSYRTAAIYDSGATGIADFGNTIIAALHYAAAYCAALWLLLAARNRYLAMLWMACLVVISTYIIMTFSRTGWVACLVPSLIVMPLVLRHSSWRRVVPVFVALAGLLWVFASSYLGYEINERGLTYRDEIWNIVLSRMESNWLWGYGAGTEIEPIPIVDGRVLVHNTHNLYLEVLYRFGWAGVIPMVSMLLLALWQLASVCLKERELKPEAFGLMLLGAASVIMLVELNSFVDSPNLVWLWFWLPVGIALSVPRGSHVKS